MAGAHPPNLKASYDVVILGAGVHGLSLAYYLGQRGMTKVAVLERDAFLGGSGRQAMIGSECRPLHVVALREESVKLYASLDRELEAKILATQQGHLTLARTDREVALLREWAETHALLGKASRLMSREELAKLVLGLDVSDRPAQPILTGLYESPGILIRQEAAIRAFARGAGQQGIEIHPGTEVTSIRTANGRIEGVATTRGEIATRTVVYTAGTWPVPVGGIDLPLTTFRLETLVTERLQPFLPVAITSASGHLQIYQNDHGEVTLNVEPEPYPTYSLRRTLPFLERASARALELFPFLTHVKVVRQVVERCDRTPDGAPLLGPVAGVEGLVLDVGWGCHALATAPASGSRLAELIATGNVPEVFQPFALSRFTE